MMLLDEPRLPTRTPVELRELSDRHAARFRRRTRARAGVGASAVLVAGLGLLLGTVAPSPEVRVDTPATQPDHPEASTAAAASGASGQGSGGTSDRAAAEREVQQATAGLTPSTTVPPFLAPETPPAPSLSFTKMKMLFISDGLTEVEGSNVRNVAPWGHDNPSYAPDGRRAALIDIQLHDLKEVHLDTGAIRMLVHFDDAFVADPYWSPDGASIVFTRDPTGGLDLSPLDSDLEVWLYDVRSGSTRKLRNGYQPAIRRDGRIVYRCAGDLCLTDITGADLGKVPNTGSLAKPAWSPDGQEIAALSSDDLVVVGADGTGRRVVTDQADESRPAWFPDGSRIAFQVSARIEPGCGGTCPQKSGIWWVGRDGGPIHQLTHDIDDKMPSLVRAP